MCIRDRLFTAPNLIEFLPFPDERGLAAADQNLSSQSPGIIIGGHYRTISTGTHEHEVFALRSLGKRAILAKEITGFANRPNNIRLGPAAVSSVERYDFMVRFVESRTDQVIHRGKKKKKVFGAGAFD